MFMRAAGEKFIIPQLELTNVKLDAPTSKWDVEIHASGIPSFLTRLIISIFKSTILSTLFDTIETQFSEMATPVVNELINDIYPTSIELPSTSYSIQTTLTSSIMVTENMLQVPLDGTVFETEGGYKRVVEAPVIPDHTVGKETQEIVAFASTYLLDTLREVLNSKTNQIPFTLLGINGDIIINSPRRKLGLTLEKNRVNIRLRPAIQFNTWLSNIRLNLDIDFKTAFDILSGDAENLVYLKPDIQALNIRELAIWYSIFRLWGLNLGIKALIYLLQKPLISLIGLNKPIGVPRVPEFDVHISDTFTDFTDDYIEVALTLAFEKYLKQSN